MVILSNPAAPLEAGDIVDAVWDEAASGHVAGGSIGALVERLDLLAAGGAGELTAARAALLSNVDVAVSTAVTQVPGGGGPFIIPATGQSIDITSGASGNNTYGAWVEMIASTAADAVLVGFAGFFSPANIANIVLDIAVGSGGSEVSIGEHPWGGTNAQGGPAYATQAGALKIAIASGSRVAARCRDESSSGQQIRMYLQMVLASDWEAWNA
jgi:hypothetical protein